jgi:hypothetical protein
LKISGKIPVFLLILIFLPHSWKITDLKVISINLNYNKRPKEFYNINNSKGSNKKPGRLKRSLLYTVSFLPFFLSHHPECANFKEHTLNFGTKRFCIGCFIGYPTGLMTFIIFSIFDISKLISSLSIIIISLTCLATFFLSPLNLVKNKKLKIFQKFIIGVGAALLIYWILELPNSRSVNLRITFIALNILLTVLNLYHVYGILKTCYKCECPFDWGNCSGFCSIRDRMENHNLNNLLLNFGNLSNRLKEKRDNKMN